MPNEYVNHVVINGVTKLDLRGDTISASDLAQGITAHDRSGAPIVGTNTGSGGSVSQDQDGYIVLPSTGGGGGSSTLKMGVIRPDAELVQTWTYDKYIVEDEGVTLPAYSTTAQTLKASASLSPTATVSAETYDAMIVTRTLATPVYGSGATSSKRMAWSAYFDMIELCSIPPNVVSGGGASINSNVRFTKYYNSEGRFVYFDSTGMLQSGNGAQGVYASPYSPSVSYNSSTAIQTVTAKSPTLIIKGAENYLNQTNFEAITDIRYQYIIELWQVPHGSLNLDGWGYRQLFINANTCANSASGKLT